MAKQHIYFILISVFILSACNHYSKTDNGLRYKFLKRSDKQELPNIGEYLQCYYSIYNSEDSMFLNIFGKTPDRILLSQETHKGGDIMEALSIMSEGDSAQFLINADSFYLRTRGESKLPSFIKPGSDLKFVIKMDKRLNKYQVDSLINVEKINRWNDEIVSINKYIQSKGLEMELDTTTGIRVQFHQKASDTAKQITENSIVTFHFVGKLMDDVEFYNSYTMGQPQTVKVLRTQFQPIGMYEMLIKMKEGEKATFILPYDLAFGAAGVDGMIPPFSTLVYQLNILKVQ
ncbi:MAG: FKBP-type peptidyl-prolyl cis-trans isomerase [Bacteroidia bacterium]